MSHAKAIAAGKKAAATRRKNARKSKKQIVGFRKKNGKTIPITATKKRGRSRIAANSKKLSVKPKKQKETALEVIGEGAKKLGGLLLKGAETAAKVVGAVIQNGAEAVEDIGEEVSEKAVETGEEAAKEAVVAAVVA